MPGDKDAETFFGDVIYDVWRSGGNPDAVDRDAVEDYRDQGRWPEEAAASLVRQQQTDPGADDYCRSCGEPTAHEYLKQPGNVCGPCADQEAHDEELNRQYLNREYERDVMP